jgi:general secretion pathway protein D
LANNSIHPDALDTQDHMMDVYKNDRRNPLGYELQPDYKMYDKQDAFDSYHGKGSLNIPQQPTPADTSAAQETYVQLTQYAAKAVRLPIDEREVVTSIEETFVANRGPVDLLFDSRLSVTPVTGWRKGGVNVTALELRNTSHTPVQVDYRNLKGQWLASTIEDEALAAQGQLGDSTYLYLISAESYDEITSRFSGGKH